MLLNMAAFRSGEDAYQKSLDRERQAKQDERQAKLDAQNAEEFAMRKADNEDVVTRRKALGSGMQAEIDRIKALPDDSAPTTKFIEGQGMTAPGTTVGPMPEGQNPTMANVVTQPKPNPKRDAAMFQLQQAQASPNPAAFAAAQQALQEIGQEEERSKVYGWAMNMTPEQRLGVTQRLSDNAGYKIKATVDPKTGLTKLDFDGEDGEKKTASLNPAQFAQMVTGHYRLSKGDQGGYKDIEAVDKNLADRLDKDNRMISGIYQNNNSLVTTANTMRSTDANIRHGDAREAREARDADRKDRAQAQLDKIPESQRLQLKGLQDEMKALTDEEYRAKAKGEWQPDSAGTQALKVDRIALQKRMNLLLNDVAKNSKFTSSSMPDPEAQRQPPKGKEEGVAPISYKDPAWDGAEDAAAKKTGVPVEVIRSIRLSGERSNGDQVSPKGARGVYQFMPATAEAFKKQYGVDAYSNDPNEQAMAAALHLKESLARNGGDISKAVAGYNGGISGERGTNPTSENANYTRRVMSDLANASQVAVAPAAAEAAAARAPVAAEPRAASMQSVVQQAYPEPRRASQGPTGKTAGNGNPYVDTKGRPVESVQPTDSASWATRNVPGMRSALIDSTSRGMQATDEALQSAAARYLQSKIARNEALTPAETMRARQLRLIA